MTDTEQDNPPPHCPGCGGPVVPDGVDCAGCAYRIKRYELARGVTLEELQRWTDGDCRDEY